MKKRNPLVVFLLSVITLGIYDIYWLVSTKKVLNAKTSHKFCFLLVAYIQLQLTAVAKKQVI
jgi:uncharacterized membrane protein YjgN (DUF898 family)